MSWRRSEMISFTTFITVISWIWWASGKVNAWDMAQKQIQEVVPTVEEHGKELAVIESSLNDIKDDVRWIRRHNNGG